MSPRHVRRYLISYAAPVALILFGVAWVTTLAVIAAGGAE